ncbi:MAG: xanthine dehydrogenase family protein subunit M [Vicinamibacteria bacterium]|nr:xanthine dehydrogenase family protein subunit M [Vicinamibacteria bacterium]
MKTAFSTLALLRPERPDEALALLRDGPLTPIAGGTDLYVALNAGLCPSRRFVDLSRLKAWRGIAATKDGGLRIGALTTFAQIRDDKRVARALPALCAAAREIGGVQIQNRATVGGNLANASPAADSAPVLLAADAELELASTAGVRRVPLGEFFVAYRHTALRADELIQAVLIPPQPGPSFFRKVGTRAANAISKVVFAGVRAARPRIALGSVGPVPLRAKRAEAALAAGADLESAVDALQQDIAPIDDLRSTAEYRRFVAAGLLRQFWQQTGGRRPAPSRRR